MRRVRQPARRERLAQRDELVERRERARRVLESRRGAARAVGERLVDDRTHSRQLRRRSPDDPLPTTMSRTVPSPIIDATFTEGCSSSSDVQRSVKRTKRRPSSSADAPRPHRGVARRAGRTVLSDDDRRDALSDERLGARIFPERAVAVRVDVDEARRDGESARVDLGRAAIGRRSRERRRCLPVRR